MEVMMIFATVAVLLSLYCDFGQCFVPIIPLAIGGGLAYGFGYMTMCHFNECCTDSYIPADFTLLNKLLKENLYGQHLAHNTVLYALRSHIETQDPMKALAMSFHGSPGTGKNYLADFIVKALYKEGEKSKYVHNYKGRYQFRSESLVEQYKDELKRDITYHLKACPRSIFIFDEVEKIPKGLLDILVPFLDYNPKIRGIDTTRAIFIFLSNTGGTEIVDYLVDMWEAGKERDEAKPQDLEKLLSVAAFNSKGGFHKSDTIESSLIDHYVPFLPLERIHVLKCAMDAFRKRGIQPNDEQIKEAIAHLTFGPPPLNRFSIGGCKRLDQKVGVIVYGSQH